MTRTDWMKDVGTDCAAAVDYRQWPALRSPPGAPWRAAVVGAVLRRVADQARIRIELPNDTGFGCPGGPQLVVHRPGDLATRIGREGKSASASHTWRATGTPAAI